MGLKIPQGVAVAAMLVGLTFGAGAQAQELEMVEAITDWSVYVDQDPKVCFYRFTTHQECGKARWSRSNR